MSDNRELGIKEIVKRIGPKINDDTISNIDRWPCPPPKDEDLPYVLILEGDDVVKVRTRRDFIGYPCERAFTVIVETWTKVGSDVRSLEKELKALILKDGGKLGKSILLREVKTVGPINSAIPTIIGIRTFYSMSYIDEGPFN